MRLSGVVAAVALVLFRAAVVCSWSWVFLSRRTEQYPVKVNYVQADVNSLSEKKITLPPKHHLSELAAMQMLPTTVELSLH